MWMWSSSALVLIVTTYLTGITTRTNAKPAVAAFTSFGQAERKCHHPKNGNNHKVVGVDNQRRRRRLFVPNRRPLSTTTTILANANDNEMTRQQEEAERLLAKAKQLRAEIEQQEADTIQNTKEQNDNNPTQTTKATTTKMPSSSSSQISSSPWSVISSSTKEEEENDDGIGYRLYVDIGREQGTWMDIRWGASGKRIEFTIDIKLVTNGIVVTDSTIVKNMVQDNFGGRSTPIYTVETAKAARLRNGFDRMDCTTTTAGYRIDQDKTGRSTIRFFIPVEGTPETGSSYG